MKRLGSAWIDFARPGAWMRAMLWGALCAAATGAEQATFNFPLTPGVSAGRGMLKALEVAENEHGQATVSFFPAPVSSREQMFVTVVFADGGGPGPALSWRSAFSGAETALAADLSDGVSGLNQRTLRVPPDLSARPGVLLVTCAKERLIRVRFDRAAPTDVAVAEEDRVPDLLLGGRSLDAFELLGGQRLAPPDAWYGNILRAPLQDAPASLEGNLQFVVPLSETGEQTLLRARFLGLPLDRSVNVWVNDRLAGVLNPVAPPLGDPGYVSRGKGTFVYAGWREGTLLIPEDLLVPGENTVLLEAPTSEVYVTGAEIEIRVKASPVEAGLIFDGPAFEGAQELPDPLPPVVNDDGFVPDLIGIE